VSLARNTVRLPLAALVAAAVALPLGACGRDEPNLSTGKALFTQKCGSCHALARAATQGQTGPNLDAAFRAALDKGLSRETVEGIVHRQILHPRNASVMPAELVTGEDAKDVAGCAGCHTLSKAGASGTIGPSLNDLASSKDVKGSPEDYVRQSLLDPNAVVVEGFQPGVMPSFEGKLSDKQLQALIQYVLGK
jgi:mono/diheme cytochrome c family protein